MTSLGDMIDTIGEKEAQIKKLQKETKKLRAEVAEKMEDLNINAMGGFHYACTLFSKTKYEMKKDANRKLKRYLAADFFKLANFKISDLKEYLNKRQYDAVIDEVDAGISLRITRLPE